MMKAGIAQHSRNEKFFYSATFFFQWQLKTYFFKFGPFFVVFSLDVFSYIETCSAAVLRSQDPAVEITA